MSYTNKNFIILAVFLFLFWIIVSGSLDIQHVLLGSVIALGISYYCSNAFRYENFTLTLTKGFLMLKFIIVLFIEITKANINVAKIVLNPCLPISPGFIRIKTGLKKGFAITLLANSITLTPGTLSVDIDGDEILVHVLTSDTGESLKDWYVVKILQELEVT